MTTETAETTETVDEVRQVELRLAHHDEMRKKVAVGLDETSCLYPYRYS